MQDRDCAVAMDVGGTQYRVAVVDQDGSIVAVRKGRTQPRGGPQGASERIIASVREVVEEAGNPRLAGIGASMASPVDPATGVLHHPPNLPGWNGYTIKPTLEEAFRIPVYIDNDANLAVVGEHRFGAGQGMQHLIYITISTGVGGGIMIDGRVLHGARGFAGEIGHIIVEPLGPKCSCGNTGCLEVMASGTAIARRAEGELEKGTQSVLTEMGSPNSVTAKEVAKAARQDDPLALEIMRDVAIYSAYGIVSLIHIFDPEAVLLGGGVTQNYELIRPTLEATVQKNLMGHQKGRDLVHLCALGDEVSLYGAAALVFDQEEQKQAS
jgi:glucokinase